MKENLILEGKTYISARQAAKLMNYAQDYIGQLCRTGKVDAKMIGRSWYVTRESLLTHRGLATDAAALRVLSSVQEIKGLQERSLVKEIKESDKQVEIKQAEIKKVIWPNVTPIVPLLSGQVRVPLFEGVSETIATRKQEIKKISEQEFSKKILSYNEEKKNEQKIRDNEYAKKIAELPLLTYEKVEAPTLPELVKKVPAYFSLNRSSSVGQASIPVGATSSATSAAVYFDARKHLSMGSIVLAMLAMVFVYAGAFFGSSIFSSKNNSAFLSHANSSTASALSATESLVKDISVGTARGLARVVSYAATSQSQSPETPLYNEVSLNGIAVANSSSATSTDDMLKQKIQNTFSDQVAVHPDNSGVSGVITPVFKKTDGDNFVYVLVPVKNK